MFDAAKAQFTQTENEMAARVDRIVTSAIKFKGENGVLDPVDFLSVAAVVPDVVALIDYLTKGTPGDPADDGLVASRGIGVFTCYGRGTGLVDKIPGPKPTTET